MKSTGIVRKVDELGRIVLPKELRRTLGISEGDPIEIFTEGETIILRKYRVGCAVCGSMHQVKHVENVSLCSTCAERFIKDYR